MAWITKRPCRIQRNGKMIVIPPGQELPEAANFKNPSMWCVWSSDETKATVGEETNTETSGEEGTSENDNSNEGSSAEGESDTDTSTEIIDYEDMTVKELKKLARDVQKETQDFATDLRVARKAELIVVIKSNKKG